MGQKVNPIAFRTGVTIGWRSRWYATKKNFGTWLVEDRRIRSFVKKEYGFAGISRIEIERIGEKMRIILSAARPGLLIGKKGAKVKCPDGWEVCHATVKVFAGGAGASGKKKGKPVAKGKAKIKGGKSGRVKLKLTKRGRAMHGKRAKVRVELGTKEQLGVVKGKRVLLH